MKTRSALHIHAALILTILLFGASLCFAGVPVELDSGKGTVITLTKQSKRVSIADPAVADISLISPKEIMLTGKNPGMTTLIIWDVDGKSSFFDVTVFSKKCGDMASLEKLVKENVPGSEVTASCEGNTVVLRGTVKNRFSCKRDREAIVTHQDLKSGSQTVESQDKDVCVESIKKVEQLAHYYSTSVMNLITIPEAEQIMLEVKVAQIDKTKLRELGMNSFVQGLFGEHNNQYGFLGGPEANATLGTSGNSVVGTGYDAPLVTSQMGITHFPSHVGVFLNALDTNGLAKILAEPNLIVRGGETGKFVAGGEIPVQEITGNAGNTTVTVVYKTVGVILNFMPMVLENGTIRLKVDPAEVSNVLQYITFSNGLVAPQIDTRRVNTSVDLKEGESLIMAGLLSEETKKSISKIPLLGSIPILGALFRSTEDELDKKELAFFITPKIVKPIPAGEKTEILGDRKITPKEEKEFDWIYWPYGDKSKDEGKDNKGESK